MAFFLLRSLALSQALLPSVLVGDSPSGRRQQQFRPRRSVIGSVLVSHEHGPEILVGIQVTGPEPRAVLHLRVRSRDRSPSAPAPWHLTFLVCLASPHLPAAGGAAPAILSMTVIPTAHLLILSHFLRCRRACGQGMQVRVKSNRILASKINSGADDGLSCMGASHFIEICPSVMALLIPATPPKPSSKQTWLLGR